MTQLKRVLIDATNITTIHGKIIKVVCDKVFSILAPGLKMQVKHNGKFVAEVGKFVWVSGILRTHTDTGRLKLMSRSIIPSHLELLEVPEDGLYSWSFTILTGLFTQVDNTYFLVQYTLDAKDQRVFKAMYPLLFPVMTNPDTLTPLLNKWITVHGVLHHETTPDYITRIKVKSITTRTPKWVELPVNTPEEDITHVTANQ